MSYLRSKENDRELRARLKGIETFVVDLDGTFYLSDKIFPWSEKFVRRVRELDKNFIFVTNNSSRNKEYYLEKIAKMGISITSDQVFSSTEATFYYLSQKELEPNIYLVGTPNLEQAFVNAGYNIDAPNPSAVVLGFDMTLTYEKLRKACDLIRRGVPFVATHPDINCPTTDGPIPDCGAMIAAISTSTGIQPVVCGKPSPIMVEALLNRYGLTRSTTAVVGDRLYTDVAMGKTAGITSILVLSGEAQMSDVPDSEHKPDIIVKDIGEIADLL